MITWSRKLIAFIFHVYLIISVTSFFFFFLSCYYIIVLEYYLTLSLFLLFLLFSFFSPIKYYNVREAFVSFYTCSIKKNEHIHINTSTADSTFRSLTVLSPNPPFYLFHQSIIWYPLCSNAFFLILLNNLTSLRLICIKLH